MGADPAQRHPSEPARTPMEIAAHDLDAAVAGVGLEVVFQPIVSLPAETSMGFEALARWPQLDNPDPQAVYAHAVAIGRAGPLDQLCIDTAITSALSAGVGHHTAVFINCEPSTPYVGRDRDEVVSRGYDDLQLVFELTERSLLTHPHALLRKVAELRADGFPIALDDVGAHPNSLALLDVISPDVIKLDLHLVQSQRRYDQARTVAAVLSHQQRTGAIILAEGIETAEHLEHALALNASLGQGFRYGRPARLDRTEHPPAAWSPPPRTPLPRSDGESPFDIVATSTPVRTERKDTLLALSRYIEIQASHAPVPPIVLAAVQHARRFAGDTRRRYHHLATTAPLVAIFGQDLPADLGSGIRGIAVDPADPLAAEWIVLTLGPTIAAALIARDHGDAVNENCLDGDRSFHVAITNDRTLVTTAARNLLDRIR